MSPLLATPDLADGGRADAELRSDPAQRIASRKALADLSDIRLVEYCPTVRAADGIAAQGLGKVRGCLDRQVRIGLA